MSAVASRTDVLGIEAQARLADLPASTLAMIRSGAAIDPAAPALSFLADAAHPHTLLTWSYAELVGCITRTANLFTSLGVGAGDVVAYALPNLPETHFTVWGAETVGIACAINPMLEPDAIAELLRAADACVLVVPGASEHDETFAKIVSILPRLSGLRHLVVVDASVRLDPAGTAAGAPLPQAVRDAVPAALAVHAFAPAVAAQPADRLVSARDIGPDDLSSFFGTGGTTGTPKIAMRRHGNEVANAWAVARMLGESIGPGTTVMCGLPMFHVNAVLATGLMPFSRGAHVLLATAAGFRGKGVLERFWEIVAHHRVNFFSAVPTVYASLLQVPIGDYDVSSLRFGLCGAAPMPIEVFSAFQQRTGLRILEGYGLTEAACVSSMNPPAGERRLGSIGLRLPCQDMKAVILDENGAYLRDGDVDEVGVIVVAGPNVFAGYRLEEHNRGLWLDLGDGRHWLNTGDLGRCDADGYFWLTGRRKELIIRGGHNIDPLAIEEPMHRHPAVQLAAAIGRPDPHSGEVPVVYVQLRPGMDASEAELLAHAKSAIGERAARPKAVYLIERMPLTAVGKIFKPALRRFEIASALRASLGAEDIGTSQVVAFDDPARGTMVRVTLADPADEARARRALGRFAFALELEA